jgi:hypothetical protein
VGSREPEGCRHSGGETHITFDARSIRLHSLVLSDAFLRTLKDASNRVSVMDTSSIPECMAEVSQWKSLEF